jgi:hypothetical protein
MTVTPNNPTVPPLDPAQLATLARYFLTFGDWLRAQVRETEEVAAVRPGEPLPEGVRSITFFADEFAANLTDFESATARFLAMVEASRPLQVYRLDVSGVSGPAAPGRPALRLATDCGVPTTAAIPLPRAVP